MCEIKFHKFILLINLQIYIFYLLKFKIKNIFNFFMK